MHPLGVSFCTKRCCLKGILYTLPPKIKIHYDQLNEASIKEEGSVNVQDDSLSVKRAKMHSMEMLYPGNLKDLTNIIDNGSLKSRISFTICIVKTSPKRNIMTQRAKAICQVRLLYHFDFNVCSTELISVSVHV